MRRPPPQPGRMSRSRADRAHRDLAIAREALRLGECAVAAAVLARGRRWLDRNGTLPLVGARAERYDAAFRALERRADEGLAAQQHEARQQALSEAVIAAWLAVGTAA